MAPFVGATGPSVPISRNPIDLFSLFFDDDVIGTIVRETNRYAEQCLVETTKTWSTNAEEIRAYIGFNILMGINRLPEIRDYWAKDKKLHYSPIASRISLQTTVAYLQGESLGITSYRKCNRSLLQ